MTNEAKNNKVLEALGEAYNEHEQLAHKYLKTLHELQDSTKTEPWVLEDCEETFHLHNCIAAVLRDVLSAGDEELPPQREPF